MAELREAAARRAAGERRAEAARRAAVVEDRQRAWQARRHSMAPPRMTPDDPALVGTHTGRQLIAQVSDTLLNSHIVAYDYTDPTLEVLSVTFPADDVVWLETCISFTYRSVSVDTGEPFERDGLFGGGPVTAHYTEEMRLQDDTWKLALSIRTHVRQDIGDCPLEDETPEVVTEAELTRIRARAEQVYTDALIAHDASGLAAHYTGQVHNELNPSNPLRGRPFAHCPQWPVLSDRDKIPAAILEPAWEHVYGASPYEERAEIPPEAAAAASAQLGVPYDTVSTQSVSVADCQSEYGTAHRVIPPADSGVIGRNTTSTVTVDEVILPSAGRLTSVAYLRTCRVLDIEDIYQGDQVAERFQPIDRATIEATEAMHLDEGRWKVAARWNISVSDVDVGCDR